jgi:hypothetical protein
MQSMPAPYDVHAGQSVPSSSLSTSDWELRRSACSALGSPKGLPTVCGACGEPWLVRYPDRTHPRTVRDQRPAGGSLSRWRFLPLHDLGSGVTLGEEDAWLAFRKPRPGPCPHTGTNGLRVLSAQSPYPTLSFWIT